MSLSTAPWSISFYRRFSGPYEPSPEYTGPERSACRPSGNQMAMLGRQPVGPPWPCLLEVVPTEPGAGENLRVCAASQVVIQKIKRAGDALPAWLSG